MAHASQIDKRKTRVGQKWVKNPSVSKPSQLHVVILPIILNYSLAPL